MSIAGSVYTLYILCQDSAEEQRPDPLFPIEFPGKFAYAKDADEFVRQETPCAHRLAERGVGS